MSDIPSAAYSVRQRLFSPAQDEEEEVLSNNYDDTDET